MSRPEFEEAFERLLKSGDRVAAKIKQYHGTGEDGITTKTYTIFEFPHQEKVLLLGPKKGPKSGKFETYELTEANRAQTAAFFSLKNSGYPRNRVRVQEFPFDEYYAASIWKEMLDTGNGDFRAKQFLMMVFGRTVPTVNAFEAVMKEAEKAQEEIVVERAKETAHAYADRAGWGLF